MKGDKELRFSDVVIYTIAWFIVLLGYIDEISNWYHATFSPEDFGSILIGFIMDTIGLILNILEIFHINPYAAVFIASLILIMYSTIRLFNSIVAFYGILISLMALGCIVIPEEFAKKVLIYLTVPQAINYIVYLIFREKPGDEKQRLTKRAWYY